MNIFVNDCPISLFLPMTLVRHAVQTAGLMQEIEAGQKVYDEWGNETGLDGALHEGSKIYVR